MGTTFRCILYFTTHLFFLQKTIPSKYKIPLIGLGIVGGLQGIVGWWMVTSGLSQEPTVSQYRLAIHLFIALSIFTCLIWLSHSLFLGTSKIKFRIPILIFALIFLTIIAGAFVAGMNAGLLYNHFPLMGDGFIPVEYGEKGLLDPFGKPSVGTISSPLACPHHVLWSSIFMEERY